LHYVATATADSVFWCAEFTYQKMTDQITQLVNEDQLVL